MTKFCQLLCGTDVVRQAVLNRSDHSRQHSLDLHHDQSQTYISFSPVTSFSYGRTGFLTLASAADGNATSMLVQKDGDMLVMGGRFQERYLLGWKLYLDSSLGTKLAEWEKRALDKELHRQDAPGGEAFRWNVALCWHHRHWRGCALHDPKNSADAVELVTKKGSEESRGPEQRGAESQTVFVLCTAGFSTAADHGQAAHSGPRRLDGTSQQEQGCGHRCGGWCAGNGAERSKLCGVDILFG